MRGANSSLVIVAVLGFLALCGSAWAIDGNEPIAHWRFDEGEGTIAYDSAGASDGTLNGDPTWVAGQVGSYALDFDGDGDYVRTGYEDAPSEYTVALWYNLNEDIDTSIFGGFRALVSKTGDEAAGVDLWSIGFMLTSGLGISNEKTRNNYAGVRYTPEMFYKDEWHHVVVTGSSTEGKIYFDGELKDTSNDNLVTGVWDDSVPFDIARWPNGNADRFFNGKIDDVRIYESVLSSEEIQELYYAGFSGTELAIMLLEDSIAEKAETLEVINETLQKELAAYNVLEELLASGDYGDLAKRDIITAKQRIRSAIQREERSKRLVEESIEKLEDALMALDWEPPADEPVGE